MRLDIEFKRRDFTEALDFPDVELVVDRFGWAALGGPSEALISASGNERQLWELLEWLRAPVRILEPYGEPVWWGYVHEATVTVGAIEVGVSLDSMYNRVAVAYGQLDAGESGPGDRATTSWAQDDDSAGTYGTRELLASLNQATQAAAEQHRDALLARYRYPTPIHRISSRRGELGATLRFVGWWHTLWWQYYANSGTNAVATTTQISTIVAGEGQFLQGSDVRAASEVSTNENRSGDEPAGQIVEELARMGTTNDLRLLPVVTRDRYLRIDEEPAFDADQVDFFMSGDGRVTSRWGSEWLPLTNPVGQWLILKDVIPATLDVNRLADAGHFFTERAIYDARNDCWIPEPRGLPSVWELGQMVEG